MFEEQNNLPNQNPMPGFDPQEPAGVVDPFDQVSQPASPTSQLGEPASQFGGGMLGTPPSGDPSIYTMPDKYMGPGKNGGSKKSMIIALVALALALVVMVVAGLFFFTDIFRVGDTTKNVNVANQNTNTVRNTNVTNTNTANLNANRNLNTNGTVNTNLSNQNTNTGLNINRTTNTNVSVGSPLPTSKDTDSDSLTDSEEDLYKTDKTKADTDGDGYFDGAEVIAGYSPTDSKPTKLADTSVMAKFTNAEQGYELVYPSAWSARSTNTPKSEVLITASTGEYIQILVQNNTQGLTALEYYRQVTGDTDAAQATSVTVAGEPAVMTKDLATIYLSKNNRIYILNYQAGNRTEVNFRTSYKVLYQSLKFMAPQAAVTTNANANSNTNVNANSNANRNSNTNGTT